jgi:hypothetical protein
MTPGFKRPLIVFIYAIDKWIECFTILKAGVRDGYGYRVRIDRSGHCAHRDNADQQQRDRPFRFVTSHRSCSLNKEDGKLFLRGEPANSLCEAMGGGKERVPAAMGFESTTV